MWLMRLKLWTGLGEHFKKNLQFRERLIAPVCGSKKDLETNILITKTFYFDIFFILKDQAT